METQRVEAARVDADAALDLANAAEANCSRELPQCLGDEARVALPHDPQRAVEHAVAELALEQHRCLETVRGAPALERRSGDQQLLIRSGDEVRVREMF